MKSLIQLQQYRKCIVFFMLGVMCSALAFVTYVINPVNTIVQHKLKMSPSSLIFSLWRKPPIGIYINVYIFNITNAEAFLNGEEKILKVEEIGPYVYEETLENRNITWNENGTISYIPKRTVQFRLDLSVGKPEDDYVMVPNIPMLGIFSSLHNAGFFVNYPFAQLTNFLDSKPILHISVQDYLWGYDDSLVSLAGTVVPSYIDFKKFGLLDRMYDEGENLINMNIKENEDMVEERGRYLSIESINGNAGLANWGYVNVEGNESRAENTRCNSIRGATEATVFPSKMDERAVFRVFRKAFCRPIPIVFEKRLDLHGLPGFQYTIPDNFADPPELNPDNECFCREKEEKECLKRGLLDLTPCYYNIPAAASMPHFLNADPTLADGIEGLSPEPAKHSTVIILQPNTGIPMYVHSRLQTNLVMRETQYNSKIAPFNGLTVPLFWTDLEIASLPDDLMLLLQLGINVAPLVQLVSLILLALGGLASICWSLLRALLIVQEEQQRQEAADAERRDSTDPRIPLDYGQYTAIRILPAIKKITSKTDLFV
ncbi:scavenger receptor class B member 1 [Nasonia vitripennis]|uniref:Scavenger receptor class B member 1 n=1 Tax=Nasonia vitripennis TaxID=7425 RepID=A0A7M7GBA6_NASVI|nr:scavenger receptor class B member 1 [Nasonia vitripennis]XP_016844989.1 scavenger receptor class B member 1 [Nasonia vitripennis]